VISRWVYVACALAGLRSFVAVAFLGAVLEPDTGIYAQGGLGLFPSPVGRALGAFGVVGLAVATVAASAALPWLAARIALQVGGSPTLAAVVALLTPLALWSIFVGVDALGAAFVLAGVLAHLRGRPTHAIAWAALAAATHLATLPLVVLLVLVVVPRWRERLVVVAIFAAFAALVLAVTPYGGNLAVLDHPADIAKVGVLTVLLALLPYSVATKRLLRRTQLRPLLVALAAGTAAAAGFVGGLERQTNARYALPLVVLLAAVVAVPPPRARPRA